MESCLKDPSNKLQGWTCESFMGKCACHKMLNDGDFIQIIKCLYSLTCVARLVAFKPNSGGIRND